MGDTTGFTIGDDRGMTRTGGARDKDGRSNGAAGRVGARDGLGGTSDTEVCSGFAGR